MKLLGCGSVGALGPRAIEIPAAWNLTSRQTASSVAREF
jgi:hypothetical protein